MKTILDAGLSKIDKTTISSETKLEQIESLVKSHHNALCKSREMIFTFLKVETLREQIWELDTTNRNNLVFYGIKEDAGTPEFAVKEIIRRFLFRILRFFNNFHPKSGKLESFAMFQY